MNGDRIALILACGLGLAGLMWIADAQPATPGTPSVCGGGVTILVKGQPLLNPVNGCVLNLEPGTNTTVAAIPDAAIGGTDVIVDVNTAAIPTFPALQGNPGLCNSQTGNTAYQCSLAQATGGMALQSGSLRAGTVLLLLADTACPTNCTLEVDGAGGQGNTGSGIKNVKQADGVTAPGPKIVPGQAVLIWYDGTLFRLMY